MRKYEKQLLKPVEDLPGGMAVSSYMLDGLSTKQLFNK